MFVMCVYGIKICHVTIMSSVSCMFEGVDGNHV